MINKLILFDLDWTLIYTGGAGLRALSFAFNQKFQIPEAMKIVNPDGKTDPAICREMIRVHLNRDPQKGEIEALCRGYLDRLAVEVPIAAAYKILPGIPVLLEKLSARKDLVMGLGTGNLEEGARIKLARADFMKYFSFGGYGSDAEDRPVVLKTGVHRGEKIAGHVVDPRNVVVIGDNVRDVQAGKAIGAFTIAVASGPMTLEELSATHPDVAFQDLSDTDKVIHTIMGS